MFEDEYYFVERKIEALRNDLLKEVEKLQEEVIRLRDEMRDHKNEKY